MSSNPVTIDEDTPLDEIVRLMERHKVKRFPVMRREDLVGMVTRTDFLTAIANVSLDGYGVSSADEESHASVLAVLSQAAWRPCALNIGVRDGVVTLRGVVKSDNTHKAAINASEKCAGRQAGRRSAVETNSSLRRRRTMAAATLFPCRKRPQ
jgi:hypothetical protein